MQIGDIVAVIATNIRKTGIICAAINITEIAPIYNIELIMLDTMLLASIRFLFILFCFSFKQERKKSTKRKKEFILYFFDVEVCYNSTS